MAATSSAPPNPYSNMAAMPGPMPVKKDDKTEEMMKGFHGIFKLLAKMEEKTGSSPDLAKAKKAMKDYVATVLKGDPSTLDADDAAAPPPPSNDNTPPPDGPAPTPSDAPPPAA